jgi:hypothetical protein
MIPLTEERKQQMIDEVPDGIWLVLREEYPQDETIGSDLLSENPEPVPSA